MNFTSSKKFTELEEHVTNTFWSRKSEAQVRNCHNLQQSPNISLQLTYLIYLCLCATIYSNL